LLYRTAKWAYGVKSDLVVGESVLESSQGVRQGDPLGPLLFSLGLRSSLADLSTHLGPNRRLLSYLDDIYILSTDPNVLPEVESFFSLRTNIITLNMRKSKTVSLDRIREDVFEMLGTSVGSCGARRTFLRAKVDRQLAKLPSLLPLPHHHAFPLLLVLPTGSTTSSAIFEDGRHCRRVGPAG